MNEKVLKELIKSRKILKNKFQSIKLNENDSSINLEKTFKPISVPLNNFIKLSRANIKKETDEDNDSEPFKFESSTPKKEYKKEVTFEGSTIKNYYTNDPHGNDQSEDELNHSEEFYSQSEGENSINLSSLKRNKKLDTVYGPHKDENGIWKFGDIIVKLNEDKIVVGNQTWAYTPGLFELLFYKKPQNYDATELNIYKKILLNTNAHRKNYKSDGQVIGNRGYKYTKIIRKMFQNTHTGKGLMSVNMQKPNYIYWDDPNELVERLKLLIASQEAGHTNQNNEIVSIIEELKEANIIY